MPWTEARYRAIVDTAVDAIIVIDDTGAIQSANRAAQSMFGYAEAELLGANVRTLMPAGHAARHDGYIKNYLSTGERKIIGIGRRVEALRRDGRPFPIELSIGEWRGEAGRRFFTGIMRDLSDRHAADEALRESREWLLTVTDTARVGLIVVGADHRIRFANRAYALLLGLTLSELIGMHMSDVVPSAYESLVKPRLEVGFAGERRVYETAFPLDAPAEEQRILTVTYEPSRSPSGDAAVVIVITDVTELKHAEADLRRSRDLLQSVLDGTEDAIFAKDAEGRYVAVNEAGSRAAGRSRADVIGRRDDEIWPPELAELFVRQDRQVMSENRAVFAERSAIVDGSRRHLVTGKRPWRGEDGAVIGVVGISRDVTEQRLAEAQREALMRRLIEAEEAERLRIARELHDHLGQDVTGLSLGLKALEGEELPQAARERVAWLRSLTDRVGRELHRTALELRPTALDDLGLRQAIESHVLAWSTRFGVASDLALEDLDEVPLTADATLVVYRCVQEALTNILKHAAATTVSIVARRDPGRLRLIIEDNGTGFDVDAPPRSRPDQGGLGLAGMRERIGLIGGSLAVESESGRGTTLFLTLDLETTEAMR